MPVTDPVADMLTRIRNALGAKHETIDVPASKLKKSIAGILLQEGFIKGYEYKEEVPQGVIRITLKYGNKNESIITDLKRISKPGLRVYANKDEVPKVLGGLGIAIISTSRGIMTDREARASGIGGEVLAYIW
jgi:small subunit ribosomal protein S8